MRTPPAAATIATMRRLIVTADDFGESPEVNEGVLEAHDRGIVTSASVMVSGAALDGALTGASARPGLCLGLHVQLTGGRALSALGAAPSLARSRGHLPASVFRLALRPPRADDVEREADAQVAAFVARCGAPPSFANTHQHAHVLPGVLRALIRVCRRHGIGALRLPADARPLRAIARPRALLWPAVSLAARVQRARIASAGLRTPDRMLGGPDACHLTRKRLLALLPAVGWGTTELVVHPRAGTDELRALTDPDIARRLDAAGVERIPFDAL